MLYIFFGSDTARAKAEARKLAGNAEIVLFGEGGEVFERALSYLGSSGLFAPEVALLIDRPFETVEGKALIEEHGTTLHKAEANVFVVAGSLTATEKKIFPKSAEVKEFEPKSSPASRQKSKDYARPNVFGFTDAFLAGDKKKMWIGYQELLHEGVSPEEIHGALSWAVRSTLLSLKANSASAAGLKPFVYTKSKRAAEKIGEGKVEQYSRDLVRVYHEARSGKGTLALNIEALLLSK